MQVSSWKNVISDSVGFDLKKPASSNLRYDCLLDEQWTFR